MEDTCFVAVRLLAENRKCIPMGLLRVCTADWEALGEVLKEAKAPRVYQSRRGTVITEPEKWEEIKSRWYQGSVGELWWRGCPAKVRTDGGNSSLQQQPHREGCLPAPAGASHHLNSPGFQRVTDSGRCRLRPSVSQGTELGREGQRLDLKGEMGNTSLLSRLQVGRCGRWPAQHFFSSFLSCPESSLMEGPHLLPPWTLEFAPILLYFMGCQQKVL